MKQLQILIFVLLLGSVQACKPWSGSPDQCREFLRGLHDDWEYNPEKRIYHINSKDGRSNKDFLPRFLFDNKDCLLGLSAKKVRQLLGEPSRLDGNKWWYYLWVSCHEKNGDCDYFLLEMSNEDGLLDVSYKHFELIE